VVVSEERTRSVVEGYLLHGAGRPALFFAVNLEHVEQIRAALEQAGVKARAVTGEMTAEERRPLLKAFSRGEVQALVSCEVLTEGYDEPGVGCVVMARPTMSRALYRQCVGWGLRAATGKGKQDCLVLDVIDRG